MPSRNTLIILEDVETAFGRIKILESPAERSRTYYQDSFYHSRSDFSGHSLIAYVHAMCGTVVQAGARKVLVLGCAGGNLATMLSDAGCEVTLVDINPYTFELAKRYFGLPGKVECINGDAREYIEKTSAHFDAVAMDVFDGGHIPAHLRSAEFFQRVASRLNAEGVVVANAIVEHDVDMLADNLGASMREGTGLPVVLLDELGEPDRNIVVVAGPKPDMKALAEGRKPLSVQKELKIMLARDIRRQACAYRDEA